MPCLISSQMASDITNYLPDYFQHGVWNAFLPGMASWESAHCPLIAYLGTLTVIWLWQKEREGEETAKQNLQAMRCREGERERESGTGQRKGWVTDAQPKTEVAFFPLSASTALLTYKKERERISLAWATSILIPFPLVTSMAILS